MWRYYRGTNWSAGAPLVAGDDSLATAPYPVESKFQDSFTISAPSLLLEAFLHNYEAEDRHLEHWCRHRRENCPNFLSIVRTTTLNEVSLITPVPPVNAGIPECHVHSTGWSVDVIPFLLFRSEYVISLFVTPSSVLPPLCRLCSALLHQSC